MDAVGGFISRNDAFTANTTAKMVSAIGQGEY